MDMERTITVGVEAISGLTEEMSDFLAERGVDARATHNVALVIDELLTNLSMHGGGEGGRATVSLEVAADEVRAEIVDQGPAFDPRSTADPDLSTSIEEREIGGLGLFLVRKLTSRLDYHRGDGENRTQFAVPRAAAGTGGDR